MIINNEEALKRAKICDECDKLFKPTWTCKSCGCFMKIKVRMDWASCPEGKWQAFKKED